jgi:hypothetical protein
MLIVVTSRPQILSRGVMPARQSLGDLAVAGSTPWMLGLRPSRGSNRTCVGSYHQAVGSVWIACGVRADPSVGGLADP